MISQHYAAALAVIGLEQNNVRLGQLWYNKDGLYKVVRVEKKRKDEITFLALEKTRDGVSPEVMPHLLEFKTEYLPLILTYAPTMEDLLHIAAQIEIPIDIKCSGYGKCQCVATFPAGTMPEGFIIHPADTQEDALAKALIAHFDVWEKKH